MDGVGGAHNINADPTVVCKYVIYEIFDGHLLLPEVLVGHQYQYVFPDYDTLKEAIAAIENSSVGYQFTIVPIYRRVL